MFKKIIFMLFAFALAITFVSCFDDDDNGGSGTPPPTLSEATVIVDYKGINHVVFFRFSDGSIVADREHDTWDLAVSCTDDSVVSNGGDFGSVATVQATENTAFGDYSNPDDYPMDIHPTAAENLLNDSKTDGLVFFVKNYVGDADVRFQCKITGSAPSYTLSIADDDGANEYSIEVTTNNIHDYIYLDIESGSASIVDFSPPKADWDLRFGRTSWKMGSSIGGRSSIAVNTATGVLSGLVEKNIGDVASASEADLSAEEADDLLNIGSNWYTYNRDEKVYSIDATKTWVIKTAQNIYVKMQMSTFYGPNKEQFYSKFFYLYQNDGSEIFSE